MWVFYEGPPTANGTPGTHHIEARVFKDVFPRYRTMKGYHVPRKAGWDCHGLPVEIAVEKELGFSGKQDIEEYGVAEFNAKCRESVLRHVDEFEQMTERMGYWVDTDQAYWTMNPEYVDSLWWALQADPRSEGLLVQDHRVAPYCPRCGTGLSDHELAQGYETVVDPSVYVRFPLTSRSAGRPRRSPPGLDHHAVDPGVQHGRGRASRGRVRARPRPRDGELLVVAAPHCWSRPWARRRRPRSRRLTGRRARRHRATAHPSTWSTSPERRRRCTPCCAAEFVTVTDGTGLVHLAPAFGPDDLAVGRAIGLPVVNPVLPTGEFGPDDSTSSAASSSRRPTSSWSPTSAQRGLLFRARALRALLPALLALPHAADVLRAALVVHPHDGDQGRAARPERGDQLVPRVASSTAATATGSKTTSTGRCPATATGVRRCPSGAASSGHLTVVGSRAELAELAGRTCTDWTRTVRSSTR